MNSVMFTRINRIWNKMHACHFSWSTDICLWDHSKRTFAHKGGGDSEQKLTLPQIFAVFPMWKTTKGEGAKKYPLSTNVIFKCAVSVNRSCFSHPWYGTFRSFLFRFVLFFKKITYQKKTFFFLKKRK